MCKDLYDNEINNVIYVKEKLNASLNLATKKKES